MGRQNLPIFLTRKAEDDKNNFWSTRLTNSTIVSKSCLNLFPFIRRFMKPTYFWSCGVIVSYLIQLIYTVGESIYLTTNGKSVDCHLAHVYSKWLIIGWCFVVYVTPRKML